MKRAFWWILGILLSPILLFLILTMLLYFPPVQNWMVDKVAAIASEKTGMQIMVDHVDLSFPLDLGIDGFHVIQQPDTIADVERMVVDVQLMPLLKNKVIINELEVNNAKFNTVQFVDAARVKGQFKRLALSSKGIDLDKQIVEVNGARLEEAKIDVALNDSVPEDTTISDNRWRIFADSLRIIRSDVALHMPGDTMSVKAHFGRLLAKEGDFDLGTQTYQLASVDWNNGSLQYDQNYEPRIEGLDYNHIDLTHIDIGVDSVYYRDPTARLVMRSVQLKEKSGLQVVDLTGQLAMDNGKIKLPKLHLKTPDSDVEVEMDMPLSLMDKIEPGKMRMRMNAQLGKQDLMRFMGGMPQSFQQHWPNYPLNVKGSVNGNMDYMEFDGLDVSLPTAFHATATGFAANLTDPKRLRAKVDFKARTEDLGFLTGMLSKDVQRNYRIPRGITAEGLVRADGVQYFADVVMREGKGMLKTKGNFNADAMRYDAKLDIRDLNIHHFMPRDSIYTVSAEIVAKGQGTDFFSPRTTLQADAKIHQLRYGSYNLSNMLATADIKNGRAHANVTGNNQLLNGTIALDALMNKKLDGTITADMAQLDLYRLRLVDKPLTIALCGHVDVSSDLSKTHYASGFFTDLTIRDSAKVYRPEDLGILVNLRSDTTYARIQSGDFIVKVDGSGHYERLMKQLTTFTDSAMAQYDKKIIDQPALRRLLPMMKLHVESKKDNPIATLLKSGRNIDFKDLLLDMTTSPETGVNGNGYIHSLVYDGTRLDTINFRLTQRKEHLSFGGQIRNNKQNPQFVFNALFDGVLQERGATMGVRYYDSANKLGARIGAKAEMVDSGIHVHLVPDRPTLGYKEFALNQDNFVFLGGDHKVKAKIDLIADDGTGVKIYSEESDPNALQDITVSLNRFDLGEITSVLPYVPRMTGLLDGDYHVVQHETGRFSMVSDMSVRNMTYEKSPIGNVSTELVYLQKEDNAHAVEARLLRDDKEIGLLNGTYFNEGEGALDAKLQLIRFPLEIVNGFVPDQIVGLEGYSEGELTIKGALKTPQVDGEVYLDSSYLVSVPYGMRMRFDNDPVRIVGSNLMLENFSLYAYNENPLTLMGSINFSDLDRILVDLRMRAKDFQVIGEKENPNSIAYGKAFVDLYGRMRGTLDNLNMRGRLNVLGSTDMSYVLRDTPLSTDNQLEELVKFTDFSDTTQVVVERPQLDGFSMDMTVDVSKGAHIMAYLNTDHSNYVDLMGGGTLRMIYTPADNLQLRGRYTLSNGEMKYSLPIIPLKTFTIQDGSYIEFTGEPMNPTLNITATERTRATVSNSSGVGRSVEFDCGVVISKTLKDMGLEFTLDAPEDMQLHSELQAMGVEQRGKLAVTMLTTGMYLADGNTGAFSMNSALSSFLNSEISQITGNALRTLDLSFGMDNSTDASGSMHTDYSFKFAKRFMNNRLKIAVGGKVSTGAELQQRNNSFFDNVSLEYRLDQTANKFITLYYQNNSYDWLDGYTQKYGAGFTWRRSLQTFWDIFRFKEQNLRPQRILNNQNTPSTPNNPSNQNHLSTPTDSLKTESNEKK
ncbi:MAG: translocation/assembly module TamB domain-containing protein [Prevotella sp.]|nr:translocation/assembly module TamB domain-containing protein [Prevotella sp.]